MLETVNFATAPHRVFRGGHGLVSAPTSAPPPPRVPPEPTVDVLPILVSPEGPHRGAGGARAARRQGERPDAPSRPSSSSASRTTCRSRRPLAADAGLPYVKINPLDLDLDVVTKGLSGAVRAQARPGGHLQDARPRSRWPSTTPSPPSPPRTSSASPASTCERVVATRTDVETINKGFYDLKTSLQTRGEAAHARAASRRSTSATRSSSPPRPRSSTRRRRRWCRALDHILSYAFEQRASDIHFEPKRDADPRAPAHRRRCCTTSTSSRRSSTRPWSRASSCSPGCNLAEKRRPQDGRIKRDQGGREIELRVSTMPTAFGEKAVLRIFDPDILLKGIDELGLGRARPAEVPRLHRAPDRDHPGHRSHRQRQDHHPLLGRSSTSRSPR